MYRGEHFRQEFKDLGEVQSLISSNVHVRAVTATAMKSLRREACHILGMSNPFVVTVSPDKSNIVFHVSPFTTLEGTFKPVTEELRKERMRMARTIIYCQQQETCARLYLLLRLHLGSRFIEPAGFPGLPQFLLVDMFSSGTHPTVKEKISESFSRPSPLRILIATMAFGMGVNPPDVRRIYHCGPSNDLEMYIQEIGCGGRDGGSTVAVRTLLYQNFRKACR